MQQPHRASPPQPSGPPAPCPWCDAPGQTGPYCVSCGRALPARLPDGSLAPAQPPPARRPSRAIARALLWAIGALLLLCAVLILISGVPDPQALGLSIAAATIPAVVIGRIILRLDRYEPEPPKALALAFLWGAAGAIVLSLFGSIFLSAMARDIDSVVIIAPLVEESFKGLALVVLTYTYRRELDNTLDGLIYGALIGLGFAFTENVLYFGQAYLSDGLPALGALFIGRAVFGGFGHAVYTGIIGAAIGWARGRYFRGVMRFVVPFLGWCLAVALHAAWNAGATGVWQVVDGEHNFFLGIASLSLIVTLPGVLLLLLVAHLAHRRELAILREQLAPEVASGALTAAEFAAVTDDTLRKQRLRIAQQTGGTGLRRLQQQFFDEAANLAYRKHHLQQGERLTPGQAAPEPQLRAELADLRARLPG